MSFAPEDVSLQVPVLDAPHSLIESHAPSGSEEQVIRLFEQFRGNILHYLCQLGLPMADSEEILQEVFLLLHQHLQQQKPQSNLRGWLFRVAHNLGLKRRTAVQLRSRGVADDSEFADRHPAPGPTPEEQFFFQERQNRLRAVVEALPAQDRHCLFLRSEGLRYREIADVLEISLGSVAKSLSRALDKLMKAEERWKYASER